MLERVLKDDTIISANGVADPIQGPEVARHACELGDMAADLSIAQNCKASAGEAE